MARFFRFPFGLSGDRTSIPDTTQPDGDVSYNEGFGPDFEIAPGDPDWKPVPRDKTNSLYYDLTDNIRQYQLFGVPEWVDASQNGGAAVSYAINVRVRHNDIAYVSLVATNVAEPGTDATKWAVDEAFSFSALEATLAESIAGTLGTKIVTPRRLASSAQQGRWNYAVAGGSADVITATLAPAPASTPVGFGVRLLVGSPNTTTVTFNLNGLGASPVTKINGAALANGDLQPGLVDLAFTGTSWVIVSTPGPASAAEVLTGSQSLRYLTPALLKDGFRLFDALLTAGTNVPDGVMTTPAIDTPSSNSMLNSTVGPGSKLTCGSQDAGVWSITGFCQYTGAGPNKSIRIHKNGAPSYNSNSRLAAQQNGSGQGNDTYTVSTVARVAAGDVISLDLLHTMGLTGQVSQGRFTVARIGG